MYLWEPFTAELNTGFQQEGSTTTAHAGNAQEYSGSGASVADTEAWDEERVALEAIYDGDVMFPSKQQTVLHADAHGKRLTLDFRIRPGGTYPDDPPIIGIR